ncbi:MAG: adenylate/guanylate cyclase domain-containing protein [Rhodospirillales bacterium]|jgi:adenylate cyclase|nr:adenylate/guanylate cyclase domain-containing protein [Rhodospirillales bacterium]
MAFEIFHKEEAAIEEAKSVLGSGEITDPKAAKHYGTLLKAYEKLFKSTKRLVRLSDRNEAELNKVAHSLDEKNHLLEGLSTKLSKYLSPQIYASIFSGEREVALETKRKKLTIFFSDIKNFTATTDDLEPEDITFLINDYLTEMSAIALKHGATIDKFIGDAVVIFFGDPETKGVQEDALACVGMAIEMQRHMMDLRAKWTEMGYSRPFQMRVGINTGYCNVGNFGSEERMDYTIIGGEVNLAARLEGVADPDGITMSYETYALVKDYVDAEKGEPITVKGIHRKINPYKLIGIFKNVDEKSRYFRSENDGMKLFLDFGKLDEDTRPNAIDQMEAAIERLRGEETK